MSEGFLRRVGLASGLVFLVTSFVLGAVSVAGWAVSFLALAAGAFYLVSVVGQRRDSRRIASIARRSASAAIVRETEVARGSATSRPTRMPVATTPPALRGQKIDPAGQFKQSADGNMGNFAQASRRHLEPAATVQPSGPAGEAPVVELRSSGILEHPEPRLADDLDGPVVVVIGEGSVPGQWRESRILRVRPGDRLRLSQESGVSAVWVTERAFLSGPWQAFGPSYDSILVQYLGSACALALAAGAPITVESSAFVPKHFHWVLALAELSTVNDLVDNLDGKELEGEGSADGN